MTLSLSIRFAGAVVVAFAMVAGGALAQNNQGYAVGDELQAQPKAGSAKKFDPAYPLLDWDTLIPASWDPMEAFKGLDMEGMTDEDPRAIEMMDRMKQEWDLAPVEASLAGKKVRVPGFAVPLDGQSGSVSEFLLVPYFGACIHTPPPPANQIIHVKMKKPVEALGAMQAYWVWGTLQVVRTKSDMGNAGYRIDAVGLQPYEE